MKMSPEERKTEETRIRAAAVRIIDKLSEPGGVFAVGAGFFDKYDDLDEHPCEADIYLRFLWAFEEGVKWAKKDAALKNLRAEKIKNV